jgi:transposase-like protein
VPELILCAVRWYLRYSLSPRDVEEWLTERGMEADHTTIWRWVQRYGPELEQRLRSHLKPTTKSWRVDETYIRVDVAGATYIEQSIRLEPRSTFCFRSCATPIPANNSFASPLAIRAVRSPA